MLYLIGIGLNNEKDITVNGLEAVKKCELVYLESYTSKLQASVDKLEKFYGKKIILADRNTVENEFTEILKKNKNKDIALLIIGDVFSATTHIHLILECKKNNIKYKIINNASMLNAVGITGLELYKFGKITSIPFDNENIKTPIEALKNNQKIGLHTLFLLDLKPEENKFMAINEAINYLIRNKINKNIKAVACCALGSENEVIKYNTLEKLEKNKYDKFPQCLIIPGKLHFVEEEMLRSY